MPLRDWKDERGWGGVHQYWLGHLGRWLRHHLPEGFRASVGSVPELTVERAEGQPDVQVRAWQPETPRPERLAVAPLLEPDVEGVASFAFDPHLAIHIDFHGQMIAAIELVSPRNKDRQVAKEKYLSRYLGYLHRNVHLMLVDLLPRPPGFSFLDGIAAAVGLDVPPTPTPFAASFRVGGPLPNGAALSPQLALWRRPLRAGEPLPALPLPLGGAEGIAVDLEATYRLASEDAYLD